MQAAPVRRMLMRMREGWEPLLLDGVIWGDDTMVQPRRSGASSGPGSNSREELDALLTQARDLHRELCDLQEQCGAYLAQLAAVDWGTLAGQGRLAGVPKFLIERAIADARHVLINGQEDLDDIQRTAQAQPENFVERLQALLRLYTDAPADIRNRYVRLQEWVAQIDRNWHERGEKTLSAHLDASS